MKHTEDEIRDHLADNLDLIEPGLVLIKKEQILKNDKGAKGFLDIFCRTADDKYLIIEVKISNESARDAIQELYKYNVLLRQNILMKDTEIRMMVASTKWHELLVPFSEFVRTSPYDCIGIRLELGQNGLTTSTSRIELAPKDKPRRISRRHFIWEYNSETKAKDAKDVIAKYMQDAGLQDFVLIIMAISSRHDPVTHLVYFAQQELTLDRYMDLIRTRFSQEIVAEFEDYIRDFNEEEDKISEAADKVWEVKKGDESIITDSTGVQISHPEKAKFWFYSDNSTSVEVFRFGRFNELNITDDMLIKEIIGEDGTSFYNGDVTAQVESKTEMTALQATADNLFYFNSVWRAAVRDLCDYAVKTAADSIRMRAFSNDDILRTVAGLFIGYPDYMPVMVFEIRRNDEVERIFGIIEWDGRKPDFKQVLKEYFDNNSFQYFMLRHFGNHRTLNEDLMAEMGLVYVLTREGDDGQIPVRVKPSCIEDVRSYKFQPITAFLKTNSNFMENLIQMFLKHEQEFMQLYKGKETMLMFFEAKLEGLKDVPEDKELIYWSGDIERCDVCQQDMILAHFMVDCAIVPGGLWGCICAKCFDQIGGKIGCGSGQLYEKDEVGWRLVAGSCTEQDEK